MNGQSKIRNEHFSWYRLFLLLKRDFLTHYRTILMASATIAAFVILASALSAFTQGGVDFHQKLYFMLLYVGGFIVASRAFRETFNSQKSYTYITLPGSPLEKFIGRWISTTFGYALGTFVIYFVICAISEILNKILFGYTHALLNPLSRTFLIGVAAFLVVQGLFFTGAVFFKKNPFIKTILMLALFAIVLLVITISAARLMAPGYFDGLHPPRQEIHSLQDLAEWLGMTDARLLLVGKTIRMALRILFWAVLAPFCWIISYLKFRKIEV
jgi:hypothetical protein